MRHHLKSGLLKQFFIFAAVIAGCLAGCSRMPTSNFQHLELSNFPDHFLLCPKNYCNVVPDMESPVFPVSAEDLFNLFTSMVSKESNTRFVYSIPEQGQFGLTTYFTFLNFPDDIDVQFIALSDTTSTLAIYSKSRLYYDFGLSRFRIEKWVNELTALSKKPPIGPSQP